MVEWLIEDLKMDINMRDDTGATPLHRAYAYRRCLAVYLEEHGADKEALDVFGRKPSKGVGDTDDLIPLIEEVD